MLLNNSLFNQAEPGIRPLGRKRVKHEPHSLHQQEITSFDTNPDQPIPPQAVVGATTELLPQWLELLSVTILLVISVKPLWYGIKAKLPHKKQTGPATVISGFPDISGHSASNQASENSCNCGCGHQH